MRPDPLEEAIATRMAFLKRVTDFAIKITNERGKTQKNEEHSGHTHVIRRLVGFGGFSFLADTGQTMYGGNTVKVARDVEGVTSPVLHVYWQASLEECEVQVFSEGSWPQEIEAIIDSRDTIARQIDESDATEQQRRREEADWNHRHEVLRARAKDLKLLT